MSSDFENPIKQAMAEGEELQEKEYEIRKKRINIQHHELQVREAQQRAFEDLPIGQNTLARALALAKENEEYVRLAKNAIPF